MTNNESTSLDRESLSKKISSIAKTFKKILFFAKSSLERPLMVSGDSCKNEKNICQQSSLHHLI